MDGIDVRATRLTRMCPEPVSCTPASFRPMSSVLGSDPTAMRQWLPSTTRPSDSVATTPVLVALTESARDFESTVMPLRLKTSSITRAASASSPGSTWSREEIRVTFEPRAVYADANSAPVTPEPTTMRCSGTWSSV